MSASPIVVDEVTAYAISCVPAEVVGHDQFRLRVRKREALGGWVVVHLDMVLMLDGTWALTAGSQGLTRSEFADKTKWPSAADALVAARLAAPHVKDWSGRTVAEVLAQREEAS